MARSSPCKWLERDAEGRPRCEHGWAYSRGQTWACPAKDAEKQRRYRATDKGQAAVRRWVESEGGREASRKWNQSDHGKSLKALHDMCRVRIS